MVFTTQHPGPWKEFINRPQNRNLPIMEVRQKYLKEQLDFENQLSTYLSWNRHNIAQGGRSQATPDTTPEVEMLTEVGELMITEDNFNIITE